MIAALTYLPQALDQVQPTGSAGTGFLSNFPHFAIESTRSDPPSVPDLTHNSLAPVNGNKDYVNSRDQLQLQRTFKVAHCILDCPCECHRKSFSWSTWSLARLFGRAYLESKGTSWVGTQHHIQSCKASATSQIRITYFVPRWFAMRMIYIRYTSSPLHGPEWLLKIPRLVDEYKNPGFEAVERGNLSMFRAAIASGECTPYDVSEDGLSLLSVSVFVGLL